MLKKENFSSKVDGAASILSEYYGIISRQKFRRANIPQLVKGRAFAPARGKRRGSFLGRFRKEGISHSSRSYHRRSVAIHNPRPRNKVRFARAARRGIFVGRQNPGAH